MSAKGIFITGTGTGVGKTLVTACLVQALCAKGVKALPMKPVLTGTDDGGVLDLDVALNAAQLKVSEETLAHLSPVQYAKPCSPHLAARLENRPISIPALLEHKNWLASQCEMLVVEGAGGLLVPLNDNETMLDLIQAFDYPVVLVIDNALGAINHSLLSIQALRSAKIPIAGVVFTESHLPQDPQINEDNVQTILAMVKVDCLGCLPYFHGLDIMNREQLRELGQNLNLDLLL